MIRDDIVTFHRYRSDPNVARYQSWEPSEFTLQRSQQFVASMIDAIPDEPGSWIQLTIAKLSDNVSIGDCAFCSLLEKNDRVSVGITISSDNQNQGYAEEALLLLMDHLFSTLGKTEIMATIDSRNLASLSLFRKLGFRKDDTLDEKCPFKGEMCIEFTFKITNIDYLVKRLKR